MSASEAVLILPGWLNSGPDHWQTLWEAEHGAQRVLQHDWTWPKRGDWMARLEETILDGAKPVVLVAHSLGCHLVSAWAAHTALAHHVHAALLVAPPDLVRPDLAPQLRNWYPAVHACLPFPSAVVSSDNDPFGSAVSGAELARHWGSKFVLMPGRGHLNASSGLGTWPQGWALLRSLVEE